MSGQNQHYHYHFYCLTFLVYMLAKPNFSCPQIRCSRSSPTKPTAPHPPPIDFNNQPSSSSGKKKATIPYVLIDSSILTYSIQLDLVRMYCYLLHTYFIYAALCYNLLSFNYLAEKIFNVLLEARLHTKRAATASKH